MLCGVETKHDDGMGKCVAFYFLVCVRYGETLRYLLFCLKVLRIICICMNSFVPLSVVSTYVGMVMSVGSIR